MQGRRKEMKNETLVELTKLVLTNKIFQFNEKTTKQLKGTVIGTNFVATFATEELILVEIELHLGIWWRCIDDICFIWEPIEDLF